LQCPPCGLELAHERRAKRGAPGQCAPQRPHHIDVRGDAVEGIARPHGPKLVYRGQLGLDEIGKLEVLEKELEELVSRKLKDEVVLTLAVLAGPRAVTVPAARRTRDTLPGDELAVSRMDHRPPPPRTVAKRRLRDIPGRNVDPLSGLRIRNATALDGRRRRLPDLLFESTNEPAAIDGALVLPVQPAVDELCHRSPP